MTTQVTVKAGGPCYPVRIIKAERGTIIEDRLLAGGDSTDFYLPQGVLLTVIEEYHPDGYPAK